MNTWALPLVYYKLKSWRRFEDFWWYSLALPIDSKIRLRAYRIVDMGSIFVPLKLKSFLVLHKAHQKAKTQDLVWRAHRLAKVHEGNPPIPNCRRIYGMWKHSNVSFKSSHPCMTHRKRAYSTYSSAFCANKLRCNLSWVSFTRVSSGILNFFIGCFWQSIKFEIAYASQNFCVGLLLSQSQDELMQIFNTQDQ